MNSTNFSFMAFAKGSESKEGSSFKLYTGVAPVTILTVNPTKEQLEKIYDANFDKEPEYLSETEAGHTARIDFIVKTDAERCNGIDCITKVSFFIRNTYRYNRDQTKVQVIDKYGRTCWVTVEQAKNHEIPVYSNGPANIDKDYRPAFTGEEDLINFLKAYLNINNVMKYVNNKWVMVDNPSDCEARLDKINNYFKGDFSELKEIINLQPNNKVKVLFGVRTTDENKQYQTTYNNMFLKNSVSDYSRLGEDLQKKKEAGMYSNTDFFIGELKEYKIEATDLSNSNKNVFEENSNTGDVWCF